MDAKIAKCNEMKRLNDFVFVLLWEDIPVKLK